MYIYVCMYIRMQLKTAKTTIIPYRVHFSIFQILLSMGRMCGEILIDFPSHIGNDKGDTYNPVKVHELSELHV